MADEEALRTDLLACFTDNLSALGIRLEDAYDDWAAARVLDCLHNLIDAGQVIRTLSMGVQTYFTSTEIPSDDNHLLAWMRAANKDIEP